MKQFITLTQLQRYITGLGLVVGLVLAIPARGSQFSFDPSRGLLELRATVNGYLEGRFGIDTGADRFYIDRGFAERAGVVVSAGDGGTIVRGLDGSSSVGYATLRSFDIQGERIYNIPADVIDLHSLTAGRSDPPDGLMGFSALRNFYITIDYPQKKLDLYSQEILYSSDEVIGVPFFLQGHLIVVNVSVDGSDPLRFFLDYCASMSIITPSALNKIGGEFEMGAYQIASEIKIVGENEISARNVTFYPRSLDDLGANSSFAGLDGILGYSFLAKYKITVDYRRELLLFHR